MRDLPALWVACGVAVTVGCSGSESVSDAQQGSGTGTEPAELIGTLIAHNQVRAQVGLPPISWDPALAALAKAWVMKCVDLDSFPGLVDHNPDRSAGGSYIGENIYGAGGTASGPSAVAAWASESASYNYASNQCAVNKDCGHYTQLVWRETARVGCALYNCADLQYGSTVVCDYAPGGNVNNRRPY
jgi:pathogenesis-related protein 1